MQLVYHQSLNDVCQGNDKVIGTSSRDNGLKDNVVISHLIRNASIFVQELLNDVTEIFGQRFSHFRARIFAGHITTHHYQLVQGNVIPIVNILFGSLDQLQFLLWVINQCA